MIDLSEVCWDDPQPKLIRRQELSRESRGTPIAADLGPAIWTVDLISKPLPSIEADALYADLLDGQTDTIVIRPRAFTYIDGYKGLLPSVTVGTVASNRITLLGTYGRVVKKGTIFHIVSGGRYQLYIALDDSNTVGGMRVKPDLRASVTAGDDVGLTPPVMEVQIMPGTLDIQRDMKGHKRVMFSGVEVPE